MALFSAILGSALGCGAPAIKMDPPVKTVTLMMQKVSQAAEQVQVELEEAYAAAEALRIEDEKSLAPFQEGEIPRHLLEFVALNQETVELFDASDPDGRFFIELPGRGVLGIDLRLAEQTGFEARYSVYDHEQLLASGVLVGNGTTIDPFSTRGPIYLAIQRTHGRAAVVIYPAFERFKQK